MLGSRRKASGLAAWIDIAPTILSHLGFICENMDGRPLGTR